VSIFETEPSQQPSSNVFSTGITALDQRLGNEATEEYGIPDGSLILVHSPSSSDLGSLFSTKLLMNLVESVGNSHGYFIHSSKPQHMLLKEFKAYNWDISKFQKEKRWNFVDMWAITSTHAASSSKIGKIDIRRKAYLKNAFHEMAKTHKTQNAPCFSVVDNLLWLKEEDLDKFPTKVMEWVKEIMDIIYDIGGIHFMIMPKGIINEVAENIIMNAVTGIVDFKLELLGNSLKNLFHISKMTGITFKSEILEITPSMDGGFRIESTGKI
jgi:KaiC/GvpD/RAD55 family RecA-like ATPase